MKQPIQVTIRALALEGLAVHDRTALGQAVAAELTQLLGVHGLPAGWRAGTPSLVGGTLPHNAEPSSTTLGADIARAAFRGRIR